MYSSGANINLCDTCFLSMNGDYMWRQDFHFTLHCERVELYFFVGVFVFDLKKEYEE